MTMATYGRQSCRIKITQSCGVYMNKVEYLNYFVFNSSSFNVEHVFFFICLSIVVHVCITDLRSALGNYFFIANESLVSL